MTLPTDRLAAWFRNDADFCGCGDPAAAAGALLRLLELHPPAGGNADRKGLAELVPDEGIRYLLLYRLDDLDLTEHGVSVDGAWLTEKGEEIRDALRTEYARDGFETLFTLD